MPEPKKYTIKTLEDLLEVPHDRLDALFVDLKQWHAVMLLAKATPMPGKLLFTHLVWIDDDKNDISVRVDIKTPKK